MMGVIQIGRQDTGRFRWMENKTSMGPLEIFATRHKVPFVTAADDVSDTRRADRVATSIGKTFARRSDSRNHQACKL